DPELRRRTGEALLLLLDRMDDLQKPEILAALFRASAAGKLSFDQFRRLGSAIDLAIVADLRELAAGRDRTAGQPGKHLENLMRTGLTALSQTGIPMREGSGRSVVYNGLRVTELGVLFERTIRDFYPELAI
ncbi:MAG: hypothetical protein ACREMX_01590, partial [Gemmatimonadales bacterium]